MTRWLLAVVLMSWGLPALADDSDFSAHLHAGRAEHIPSAFDGSGR